MLAGSADDIAVQVLPLYRVAHHQPRTLALFPDTPTTIIAHRGWSTVAPENTLSAFHRAAELGVAVELDVGLCQTGEPVVLHDDTLDRTTSGTGAVADHSLQSLRLLDAGAWFDEAFRGEPLPTLRDALHALKGRAVVDIELKTTDAKAALAAAVVADVEAMAMTEQVFVTSFDPYLLKEVRLVNPSIPRGQLVGTDLAWYERVILRNLLLNGGAQPDLILAEDAMLTPSWLTYLQSKGYPVFVWTVNDASTLKQWIDLGINGIITDVPDRAVELLGPPASPARQGTD